MQRLVDKAQYELQEKERSLCAHLNTLAMVLLGSAGLGGSGGGGSARKPGKAGGRGGAGGITSAATVVTAADGVAAEAAAAKDGTKGKAADGEEGDPGLIKIMALCVVGMLMYSLQPPLFATRDPHSAAKHMNHFEYSQGVKPSCSAVLCCACTAGPSAKKRRKAGQPPTQDAQQEALRLLEQSYRFVLLILSLCILCC